MAFTPVSGNDGRVKKTGGAAIAGLGKWDITKTTAKIVIPHFESATDADGNVYPSLLRGLSGATGTASGQMNTNAADATDSGVPGLSNGLTVNIDLILVKGTPWGIPNLPCFIDSVTFGSDINNQAAPFSMQFTIDGVCGKTE